MSSWIWKSTPVIEGVSLEVKRLEKQRTGPQMAMLCMEMEIIVRWSCEYPPWHLMVQIDLQMSASATTGRVPDLGCVLFEDVRRCSCQPRPFTITVVVTQFDLGLVKFTCRKTDAEGGAEQKFFETKPSFGHCIFCRIHFIFLVMSTTRILPPGLAAQALLSHLQARMTS